MSIAPVIGFGQQPCGFFPRRYLIAKLRTARRLQTELGGEIVFFYHDSDHDPRETRTILRRRDNHAPLPMNFSFENKIQRKFSPLYLKRIPAGWQEETLRRLPPCVDPTCVDTFQAIAADTIADFCLEMYRRMGWLEGVRVVRSSDPAMRRVACPIADFFVDIPHAGEVVRARRMHEGFQLHEGGDRFIQLPDAPYTCEQISPARDTRLRWMQSVLHCTYYICGAGERAYLDPEEAPGLTLIDRDFIDRQDEAYAEPAYQDGRL